MSSVDQCVTEIRGFLTPKQHVLGWIDDIRRYHSHSDYMKDQQKRPVHEWDMFALPKAVLESIECQAVKLDSKQQRAEARKALRDLAFLRHLISDYNDLLARFLLAARPEAANVARTLQQAIMREAVSADVESAVALLQRDGISFPSDKAGVRHAERRAVIARLDCHSLRPCLAGTKDEQRDRFHKLLLQSYFEQVGEVRAAARALLLQTHVRQNVGDSIARTFFAGHPILFPENERRLATLLKWMEVVVEEYNEFIRHRIEPLLSECPRLANAVSGSDSAENWSIVQGDVQEEAEGIHHERVAVLKSTALTLALVAIGEKELALRPIESSSPSMSRAAKD